MDVDEQRVGPELIYRGARVDRLKLDAGLFLYQLLALGTARRYSSLDAAKTLEREPALLRCGYGRAALQLRARQLSSRTRELRLRTKAAASVRRTRARTTVAAD